MDYQIQLNNGGTIDLKGTDIDAAKLVVELNDQKTMFVNFGGAIISKHIIVSIIPIENITE